MQEYAFEFETDVDKVLVNVIKRNKSYDIVFRLGFFISYKNLNNDYNSKGLNLTHQRLFQETGLKVSTSQVIRL